MEDAVNDRQQSNSIPDKASGTALDSSYSNSAPDNQICACDLAKSGEAICNTIFSDVTSMSVADRFAAKAWFCRRTKRRLEAAFHLFNKSNAMADDTFMVAYTAAFFGLEFAERNAKALSRTYDRKAVLKCFSGLES